MIGGISVTSTLFPFTRPTRFFFSPTPKLQLRLLRASSSSTTFLDTNPTDSIAVEKEVTKSSNPLACPVCYNALTWTTNPALSIDTISGSSLQCSTCQKTYTGDQTHLELTTISNAKNYGESMPASTELFRTPLVSFLYERGWRQTFSVWGGFPGPEKEFEQMKGFLKPVLGGNIIDASCGSGLFSRLFAKSGLFSLVVALDYSENMLRQCYEFVQQEDNFPKENFILVRADIARLPFVSSSIDAVHAGAALHCWPSPSAAVAEISRILRPGGVFVATTYILDGPFTAVPFLSTLRQKNDFDITYQDCEAKLISPVFQATKGHQFRFKVIPYMSNMKRNINQVSGIYTFLSERELEALCKACGLVGFKCIRNGPFVMISAAKPK